ncbi:class D beta-lactamase [bacterium]|nr:class D beta-lactamase [bacterium]
MSKSMVFRRLTALALLLLQIALAATAVPAQAADDPPQPVIDLGRHFGGLDGCIVVFDSDNGTQTMFYPARCKKRYLPCSTFKIPHALMALDAGVLAGPDDSIDFDAISAAPMGQRSGDDLYGVKSLRQAIEKSLVWYFQELARRLGPEREATYLAQFNYGNMDSSSELTTFWLDGGEGKGPYGSLAISADEQVRFLQKFYEGCLGTSPEALAGVKDCIRLEEAPGGYVLSGKTGSGRLPRLGEAEPKLLGWFVGYVERPGKSPVYYALNLEADDWETTWEARKRITKACLAELGYWPAGE